MGVLVTARCDANLADYALGILTLAIFGISGVATRSAFGRELPIVTLVIENVVGPRLLDNAHALFKQ